MTGLETVREALRVRSRLGGFVARLARDTDTSVNALENFAHDKGNLSAPVIDKIVADLFHGHRVFNHDSGELESATKNAPSAWPPPITHAPLDPTKLQFYQKPSPDGRPTLYPRRDD